MAAARMEAPSAVGLQASDCSTISLYFLGFNFSAASSDYMSNTSSPCFLLHDISIEPAELPMTNQIKLRPRQFASVEWFFKCVACAE